MGRPTSTLKIYQGEDFIFEVEWTDEFGEPVDLTGCTAKAQVREREASETVVLEFDSEAAPPTITMDDGAIILTAAAADTEDISLPWGGRWDLEVYPPNGETIRLVMGSVTVSPEVTRG